MTEYDEIIKWHPHLVLVSEKPPIWHGLITINTNTRIIIKLKIPNYPKFKDASIQFDEKISLMYGTDFPGKISTLLINASSVMSFLSQLQRLMDNIIKKQSVNNNVNIEWPKSIDLEELKSALRIPGVSFAANNDMSIIKITYRNISIKLKQDLSGNRAWVLHSSDLPELKSWQPLDTCVSTLRDAANELKTRTVSLESVWLDLRDIDDNCWVIEPVDPKPHHLHRRIYLNIALSLLITLDPTNNESLQEIKVLGSDSEVAKCQETINGNLSKWNNNQSITENLMELLNLNALPKRPNESDISQNSNSGLVSDNECGICFSIESDNEEYPSIVCNNQKCQRNFHADCLLRWLQSVAGNQIVFERIHGACPHCNETISCHISN